MYVTAHEQWKWDTCQTQTPVPPSARDVRKFKDTKKQFDRVREDMELAQVKNAQAPRNKVHEAEEATQALILSRKAFRHLALDYVLQVQQHTGTLRFSALPTRGRCFPVVSWKFRKSSSGIYWITRWYFEQM